MPAHDIRLLIADVDGTLVSHDKTLTAAAVAAAGELRAARIAMALTSARPPWGMSGLVEPLGLDQPLAGFNGGLIIGPDTAELEAHPIAPDHAAAATRLLEAEGLDVWTYTDSAWFVSRADGPHVAREAWIIGKDPELYRAAGAAGRIFKIVGVGDDPRRMAEAERAMRGALGEAVNVARSSNAYLDVTGSAANKGRAARSLAARLGLPRERIAAIGDMPNDILMFRECGLSIAMGNAADAVKAAADVVTDSNEDDGFAKAVRRFVLPAVATEADDRRAS